jgi:hypothetical protein
MKAFYKTHFEKIRLSVIENDLLSSLHCDCTLEHFISKGGLPSKDVLYTNAYFSAKATVNGDVLIEVQECEGEKTIKRFVKKDIRSVEYLVSDENLHFKLEFNDCVKYV